MVQKFIVALLCAQLAACMAPPPQLDLSLHKPSQQQKYRVSIRPLAAPVAIQQMHTWEVQLTSPDAAPVLHAQIGVDGGMPQHGHGLPTQPRVTQELGGGRYLVEGMKFSMAGWWEIKLALDTPERGPDTVTFNLVLAPQLAHTD